MSEPEDPAVAPDKVPNLIEWFGYSTSMDFSRPPTLGGIFRVVFSLVLILFYGAAIVAAAYVIKHTIAPTQNPISDGPSLGAGALIAAILAAPFVIWRTLIAQRTVDLQHQGQITDRISKAVEQLGAEKTVKLPGKDGLVVEQTKPNIEVRIGGLYALERIAQDSMTFDKGRDHISMMEILCAYIRENAPASEARRSPHEVFRRLTKGGDGVQGLDAESAIAHPDFKSVNNHGWAPADLTTENLRTWARALPPPRTDLQTALEIIGRRSPAQIALERATPARGSPAQIALERAMRWRGRTTGYRLDLRNCALQRADLSPLDFDHALFTGTRMAEAVLSGAQMAEAVLSGAQMAEAILRDAQMEGASLSRAQMQGASLSRAQMEGAVLRGVQMQEAILWGAQMKGANLSGAQMQGADLSGANLRFADLSDWTIARTSLRSADFTDATGLTQAALDRAYGDSGTILPPGLVRPAHWDTATLANYWDGDPEYRAWLATTDPAGQPLPP